MFERFNGNVVPFADESTSTNRTVFGSETQSDDIDDNLNADFKKGWEIVGLNDNPTREDFNAMGYTLGYLTSYLYQNGVAEYNLLQEYKTNSIAIGVDGNIYQSLVDNNLGNALSDTTKWVCIASKNSIVNSIAELKTISNIESINVLGYYEKGDGGGGIFYWDATSTETDNGGTIIQATGVVTGRWKRVFSGAVNVKWFGAKSDYYLSNGSINPSPTNNYQSIQNAINLKQGITSENGVFYYIGTLAFESINSTNTNKDTSFKLDCIGASFVCGNITDAAIKFDDCKKIDSNNFIVQHSTFIEVDGLWNSSFSNCSLGVIKFAPNNINSFDSHYWNIFLNCSLSTLHFYTGSSSDRTEFNSNIFEGCKIWGGDYAFKVYGNQNLQGISFIQCDISYQTVGLLYVDEIISDGNFNFIGGYFDSNLGFPIDTKGLKINSYGSVNAPNSANLDSFTLKNGSFNNVDVTSGVRNGSRLATSSLNLIIDGDLGSKSISNFNVSGVTTTIVDGAGYFGKYINFTTSLTRQIPITSIAVPFTGWYNFTIIGSAEGNWTNQVLINSTGGIYGAVDFSNEPTVSSYQVYLNQGDIFVLNMGSIGGSSNTFKLYYSSLTYGRQGSLGCSMHPIADRKQLPHEVIGLKKEYITGLANVASVIKNINLATYGRVQIEVTIFAVDTTSPDGSLYCKYIVLATRGTGAITSSVTSIASLEIGETTGTMSITTSEDISGVLSIKLTMPNGESYYKAELYGSY